MTINLPHPECEGGYPEAQVDEILREHGRTESSFWQFMNGQTMMLCTAQCYSHETQTYSESCGGVAHGGVVYVHDMRRFLERKPVID